jgi:hypothetical protein
MRPLLAYARTHNRYKIGCTCSGHLLSQHLPTWDEWSSPSELIHPGDRPSISNAASNQTKPVYRWGIRAVSPQYAEPGSPFVAAGALQSGSGHSPVRLPQRLAGPGTTSTALSRDGVGANVKRAAVARE